MVPGPLSWSASLWCVTDHPLVVPTTWAERLLPRFEPEWPEQEDLLRFAVQRVNSQPRRILAFDHARLGESGRKAAVLLVVVAPFIATIVAIVQLWNWVVTWRDLIILVGMYIPISLGVTAGFHRMLTHRSFRAHPVVRAIMLILGSMAVEGTAITWAANHLKHHSLADQEGDPHSPVDGLFHAHLGWLFTTEDADPQVYCRHL